MCHKCDFVKLDKDICKLFWVIGMSPKEIQEDPCQQKEEGRKPTDTEARNIIAETKKKLDEKSFHLVRNAFIARCARFGLDP